MADHGSRERDELARPVGVGNPPRPFLKTPEFPIKLESLLDHWNDDIKRAARRAALASGGSIDDAEDFEQAARRALARAGRRMPNPGEFYIRRIIQNAVRGAARRERRPFGAISQAKTEFDERAAETRREPQSKLAAAVSDWVSELPDRMQQLYDLLYVQGYTQRETAQLVGVSQPRIAQLHAELLRRGRVEFSAVAA